jgi:Uma2 family endonuclease
MAALITDPQLQAELVVQRQASGTDRFDEVWEGLYVMAPLANDEHQALVNDICAILTSVVAWPGLGLVRPGVNVSDREKDWKSNYRCPDAVVFLNGTAAVNHGAFWFGGPDLAVEIVSPGDQAYSKIPFYAQVGTRELLIVDRDPWRLILFRLRGGELVEVGRSDGEQAQVLQSQTVGLSWQLTVDSGRRTIVVHRIDGEQTWRIRTG